MQPHERRLTALWALIESDVDALLISDVRDVRWASGFDGSAALLVIRKSGATLIVDPRYGDQAHDQAPQCAVLVGATVTSRDDLLRSLLRGCHKVGFDERRTTVGEWKRLCGLIDCDFIALSGPVATLRSVKDAVEIEAIERAATIASHSFLDVRAMVGVSAMTELDVRDELVSRMRAYGADDEAYPTIVASGPNSAFPHHQPTKRLIQEGDSVVIDVGAEVDGYRSDMTRTLFVGHVDPRLADMFAAVLVAQQTVVEAVRPGVVAGELDRLAREVLCDHEDLILHATGHGVGMDIHEAPWLRSGSRDVLDVHHVVTVEPGLYRVGVGGVRIEDLLLVEPSGSRTLTLSPKDPLCPQSAPTT